MHLSSSRLLRPIQAKAVSLAHAQAKAATYVYHGPSLAHHAPPLALLPPPRTLAHFDKYTAHSLDLARRIYAVRDAFRDLVASAHRDPAAMTLAAICATVLGENMPHDDPDADDPHHQVDNFYDAVPPHYRGYTVVAHALSLVLDTCSPHSTLLSLLLDVVLAHRLTHHATTLLHALLLFATSPNPHSTPISHPAHSAFLVDLRYRWLTAGLPHTAFLRVLLDVMHAVKNPDAWSSKATRKLARTIYNDDLPSFIHLLTAYAHFASSRPRLADRNQLSKWLTLTCTDLDADSSDAALDFLNLARTRNLLRDPELSDAIVRLATQCLPFHTSSPSLVTLLHQATPCTSTYAALVDFLYTTYPLEQSHTSLEVHAHALRAHGLLRLEASLWGCALLHIDNPEHEHLLGGPARVKAYRQQLMDLVEDTETSCFGTGERPILDGWEWEPAVGCWAPKTDDEPPKKRRRTEELPCIKSKRASSVNFASLLADSLSNRTVLHPGRQMSRRRLSIDSDDETLDAPPEAHPPSDDILDLFAYIGSSPSKLDTRQLSS